MTISILYACAFELILCTVYPMRKNVLLHRLFKLQNKFILVDIYSCLPPGRIWYKVFFYSDDVREEEVEHDPKHIHMVDYAGYRNTMCNVNYTSLCYVSKHICQVILLVIDSVDPKFKGDVSLCLSLLLYPVRMSGGPADVRYLQSELQRQISNPVLKSKMQCKMLTVHFIKVC